MSNKYFISNSGGRTSGYLTYLYKDLAQPIFMNTGEEHPETYSFIENQVKEWGLDHVFLEYELPKGFYSELVVKDLTYENLEKYGWSGLLNNGKT